MILLKQHLNKIIIISTYLFFPLLILKGLTHLDFDTVELALLDTYLFLSPLELTGLLYLYLLVLEGLIALSKYLRRENVYGKFLAGIFLFTSSVANLVFIFTFILMTQYYLENTPLRFYLIPLAFLLHEVYTLWRYLKA